VRVVVASWARARLGNFQSGEAAFAHPLAQLRASGWRLAFSYFYALKADAHHAAGHLDRALEAVGQGLAEAEAIGEHYYEPELYRMAGELTLARWPERTDEAHDWFRRAVVAAQAQGAVAWERRAAPALARLGGPPARGPRRLPPRPEPRPSGAGRRAPRPGPGGGAGGADRDGARRRRRGWWLPGRPQTPRRRPGPPPPSRSAGRGPASGRRRSCSPP